LPGAERERKREENPLDNVMWNPYFVERAETKIRSKNGNGKFPREKTRFSLMVHHA
jgi:hypothetical protein